MIRADANYRRRSHPSRPAAKPAWKGFSTPRNSSSRVKVSKTLHRANHEWSPLLGRRLLPAISLERRSLRIRGHPLHHTINRNGRFASPHRRTNRRIGTQDDCPRHPDPGRSLSPKARPPARDPPAGQHRPQSHSLAHRAEKHIEESLERLLFPKGTRTSEQRKLFRLGYQMLRSTLNTITLFDVRARAGLNLDDPELSPRLTEAFLRILGIDASPRFRRPKRRTKAVRINHSQERRRA